MQINKGMESKARYGKVEECKIMQGKATWWQYSPKFG